MLFSYQAVTIVCGNDDDQYPVTLSRFVSSEFHFMLGDYVISNKVFCAEIDYNYQLRTVAKSVHDVGPPFSCVIGSRHMYGRARDLRTLIRNRSFSGSLRYESLFCSIKKYEYNRALWIHQKGTIKTVILEMFSRCIHFGTYSIHSFLPKLSTLFQFQKFLRNQVAE